MQMTKRIAALTPEMLLAQREQSALFPEELEGTEPLAVNKVGVVGGGTMGSGIAAAALDAGLLVSMVERDEAAAERGRKNVSGIYERSVRRGRISDEMATAAMSRFSVRTDYSSMTDCDLVIEAVFEDLDVKRTVFAELERICPPTTILATNTSYLDPREIFAAIPNAERLIGLHFFSPANIMKLLEIVPLPGTTDAVIASAFSLAGRMKKIPVRAGICDGFIGNRILKGFREQAERLLLRGADPGQIDSALRDFGFAMGPFEVQDLAGLDIAAYQRAAARARGEVPFAPVADALVQAERLGRKTQAGWYDYADGRLQPESPEIVSQAISMARGSHNFSMRYWSGEDICKAMILPMINEAAVIVSEGIALRASDVDLVEVHGYGFPRFRGGPVEYGRTIGFGEVAASLEELQADDLAPPISERLRIWATDQAES